MDLSQLAEGCHRLVTVKLFLENLIVHGRVEVRFHHFYTFKGYIIGLTQEVFIVFLILPSF